MPALTIMAGMRKSQVHARDLLHFILPGAFLPAGYLPQKLGDEIDIRVKSAQHSMFRNPQCILFGGKLFNFTNTLLMSLQLVFS